MNYAGENMWDRSKQKYWINRFSLSIIRVSDNKKVCDFPRYISFYNTALTEKICFANSDKDVKLVIDEYVNSKDHKDTPEDDCLMFLLNQEDIKKRMWVIDTTKEKGV